MTFTASFSMGLSKFQKMARVLVLIMATTAVGASSSVGEVALANITRSSNGDLFFLEDSDCGLTRCMEVSHGTALSAMGADSGCHCQCRRDTPAFREDQRVCVNHVGECLMASFGRGATRPQIPFVFLPLKGQIIYPSKEIIFTDVEDAICAVTSAQYLSHSGWVTLRDLIDNDVPFGLYRDEGSTFLQWRGSSALHARLEGRLVAVHVLCSATNSRLVASCAAFRVAGATQNGLLDVRSIPFHAGEIVSTEPSQNQGLSVLESLAIGVCVLLLIFVYAAGIIFYIHYKQRQKRKRKDPEQNHTNTMSTDRSSLESRIDMSNVMLKTNPLLKLNGMGGDFLHDGGFSDVNEHIEDNLDTSPSNTHIGSNKFQKLNANVISAMVHSRKKKTLRPSIRNSSIPQRMNERFQRRSASPDTLERVPHSELSIVDCTVENNYNTNQHLPYSSNGDNTYRKKLYFNPVFFETEHLKNPPPAAIEFLIKIREVMSIAKDKMSAKKYLPILSDIPEEDLYHSIDLGWDIPCARRGRRFSAISLKQENSRKSHCSGCPGCDNENKRVPKVTLTRSNSCKSCVSEDYKQKIVRKWLDEVPLHTGDSQPIKSVAKVNGTPRIITPKKMEISRPKSAELIRNEEKPNDTKPIVTEMSPKIIDKDKILEVKPQVTEIKPKEAKTKITEVKPKLPELKPKSTEIKPKEPKPKITEEKPKPPELKPKPSDSKNKLLEVKPKLSDVKSKIAEVKSKIAESMSKDTNRDQITKEANHKDPKPLETRVISKPIRIEDIEVIRANTVSDTTVKENIPKPAAHLPSEKKSPPNHTSRRIRKKLPPPPPPPVSTPSPPVPSKTDEEEAPIPPEVKVRMQAVIRELHHCRKVEPVELEEIKMESITPIAPKIVIPVLAADSHYYSDDNMLTNSRKKEKYSSYDNFMDFDSLERNMMKKRRFSVACGPELASKDRFDSSPNLLGAREKITYSWHDVKKAVDNSQQLDDPHTSNDEVFIEPVYNNTHEISKPGPLTIQVRGSPVENRRHFKKDEFDFDPDTLDRRDTKKRVEKILLKSAGSFKYKSTSSESESCRKSPVAIMTRKIGNLRQIYEAKAKAQEEEMKRYYSRRSSVTYGQDMSGFMKGPDLIRHIKGQKDPKPPIAPKQRGPEQSSKFNIATRESPPGDRRRVLEDRDRFLQYNSTRLDNLNARRSGRRSARTRSRRTDLRKIYRTEDSGYMSTDSNESKCRARYLMQLKPVRNIMPELAPVAVPVPAVRTVINKTAVLQIESDTDDLESLCDGRSESGGESVETDSVFFGNFDDSKEIFAELGLHAFEPQKTMVHSHEQIDSGFIGETNIIMSGDSDSEHRSVISIMTGHSGRVPAKKRDESKYLHTIEC